MGDEKETGRGRETEEGEEEGEGGTRSSVGREVGEDLGRVGDERDQIHCMKSSKVNENLKPKTEVAQ